MKKTYWWRISALLAGVIIFGYSYIAAFGNELGLCEIKNAMEKCMVSYNLYIDSLGFISISIIIISIFLFFFSDKFFIKWLRFALIWFFLVIVFVALTPEQHNFMNLNPDKETISIWMSAIFIVVSLGMFGWEWRKGGK